MHRQFSLAKKLPAAAIVACLLFGLLSWILLHSYSNSFAAHAIEDKGYSTLDQLMELVRPSLFNNDLISLQVALQKAAQDDAIYKVSLTDIDDQLVAQSNQPTTRPQSVATFTRHVEIQDTMAGTITVEINSQLIHDRYTQAITSWLLVWLLFTAVCGYGCYYFSRQLSLRLQRIIHRLPGNSEKIGDEFDALEQRLQPLLANTPSSDEPAANQYYYSLITATFKNRQQLNDQLNQENLTQLFEQIDYCTSRTLELYGGQRINGEEGCLNFFIRSTQLSKQHLLVCMMAVYTLQQLLDKLSEHLGVELEVTWAVCSKVLVTTPRFSYDEGVALLKKQSKQLSHQLQSDLIGLYCDEFDLEQLSAIASFQPFSNNLYLLTGFSEQRQSLLNKQLEHLGNLCI